MTLNLHVEDKACRYLVVVAGQGAVARIRPAEEARRVGAERPRRVGAHGTRGRRADRARRRGTDRTGWRIGDRVGLGQDVAVVVLLGRAGRTGGKLGWLERVHKVHLGEDGRWRDEIQFLLHRENLHIGRIYFLELRFGQVVHDTGPERVAHNVDGGAHPVAEW